MVTSTAIMGVRGMERVRDMERTEGPTHRGLLVPPPCPVVSNSGGLLRLVSIVAAVDPNRIRVQADLEGLGGGAAHQSGRATRMSWTMRVPLGREDLMRGIEVLGRQLQIPRAGEVGTFDGR